MIGVRMANYRVINRWREILRTTKCCVLFFIVACSISVFAANISYYGRGKSELKWLPKISFGIDIVGGNQLTVAIDSSGVINEYLDNNIETIKIVCNEQKLNCDVKKTKNDSVDAVNVVVSGDKEKVKNVLNELRKNIGNINTNITSKSDEKLVFDVILNERLKENIISDATDKAIAILKNRIDGVGVKEISIQRYGSDKIVLLVPQGVDISRIKMVINTTAKLTFHLMDRRHIFVKKPDKIAKDYVVYEEYGARSNNDEHLYYLMEQKPTLNGDCMTNVQPYTDGLTNAINFRMNSAGTKKFGDITRNNVGSLLAIVLDGRVLMAPRITTPILSGNGSITGNFTREEIADLSVLLRSGSLPAKITIINDRHLSSIFDKNILSKAGLATIIGLTTVAMIIILRYKKLGAVAMFALCLNFLLTLAIIAIFGLTLTLPGIAGFVLMLGMAIDANILIYEKMKELKRQGITQTNHLIQNGFAKALSTIIDSNVTTVIAAVALFGFGGSFIKGFSITLILGIMCSIFTAVNITKMIVAVLYSRKSTISV